MKLNRIIFIQEMCYFRIEQPIIALNTFQRFDIKENIKKYFPQNYIIAISYISLHVTCIKLDFK